MKMYCVSVKEIYSKDYYVIANNPNEAIEKAQQLIQEQKGELQHDYTLEPDEWGISELN